MRYLSVCSGIEAATQAWQPLGWEPVAFSEIEPFPCAVLAHHYPTTPNWGDMTKFEEWPDANVDVLCGGTPCQSFSVAGLRKGLADPRGNLMLTFGAIADRYRPEWVVWENVPGVLSSNKGRDFGAFLGMLGQLGYGWAYRTLDAQYVRTCRFPHAIPQRRRRVFVVGYLGDWRRAAAVLFDRESLSGNPTPRREPGKRVAAALTASPASSISPNVGSGQGTVVEVAETLTARGPYSLGFPEVDGGQIIPQTVQQITLTDGFEVCGTLSDGAHNGGGLNGQDAYTGRILPVAHALRGREGGAMPEGPHDTANIRAADCGSSRSYIAEPWAVRRLTPIECERLQGFPDDFTRIPYRGKPADRCPDGPRYKALGNSWAVNCAEWIGERIQEVSKW